MNDEYFMLFVMVAMHSMIGKASPNSTFEEIALLSIKQAEAVEKALNERK
jgi:hypothetical protein